jgi:hypothetical protein
MADLITYNADGSINSQKVVDDNYGFSRKFGVFEIDDGNQTVITNLFFHLCQENVLDLDIDGAIDENITVTLLSQGGEIVGSWQTGEYEVIYGDYPSTIKFYTDNGSTLHMISGNLYTD